MEKYQPEKCAGCGQNKTYVLAIDQGTVDIVKATATAIRLKGINCVHPTKEMEVPRLMWNRHYAFSEGKLTSTQIGNMTRARIHGLLARVKDEPGNWCLTRKGAEFLRGQPVPKFAVVRKVRDDDASHNECYWKPETYQVKIDQYQKGPYWEGYNYQIVEGRVVPAEARPLPGLAATPG